MGGEGRKAVLFTGTDEAVAPGPLHHAACVADHGEEGKDARLARHQLRHLVRQVDTRAGDHHLRREHGDALGRVRKS